MICSIKQGSEFGVFHSKGLIATLYSEVAELPLFATFIASTFIFLNIVAMSVCGHLVLDFCILVVCPCFKV